MLKKGGLLRAETEGIIPQPGIYHWLKLFFLRARGSFLRREPPLAPRPSPLAPRTSTLAPNTTSAVIPVFFALTPLYKDNYPDNAKKTGIQEKAPTNGIKSKRTKHEAVGRIGRIGRISRMWDGFWSGSG